MVSDTRPPLDVEALRKPETPIGRRYPEAVAWDDGWNAALDAVEDRLAAAYQPTGPDDLAGPDDPYITIREKDLRDAWLRLDAVGDPRTAHALWQHLLGVTLTGDTVPKVEPD